MHFEKQCGYMAKHLSATPKCVLLSDFAAPCCCMCKMVWKSFCGSQSDVILKLHKEALFSNKS